MEKRKFLLFAVLLMAAVTAKAGGLMTNTNYHIAFDRMFARGATFEIDAAYSNPAGLAWGHEGWQLSLNFQKPWQNRDIETQMKKYPGKASAPVVPALFASYKEDRWVVSTMIGIVGSGGFVKYDQGVPMFNVPIAAMLEANPLLAVYSIDSEMKGKQYIYGGQLNFTYKLTDKWSAAVGIRANYYDGYYKGYVGAEQGIKLVNLQLDCPQTGWGFTPVVGLDFHTGPLTLAAKFEFRTKLSTENDTKELVVGMMGVDTDVKALSEKIGNEGTVAALAQTALGAMSGKVKGYLPHVKTRYDMPSLFTFAVGYEFTPKLRAAAEYHFFDDKNAKMPDDRQDALKHGTYEVLLGAEYDINDKFTVSLGGQRTDYGLSDDYQQDTSFACDSYSIGFGGAWNITDKVRLNASYFCSLYSDYKKMSAIGQETFSRTNNVIGIGLDYKF